jgi:hypothetical protein
MIVGFEVHTPLIMMSSIFWDITLCSHWKDRLCGLVVRVLGSNSRGHGSDSRRYQIF